MPTREDLHINGIRINGGTIEEFARLFTPTELAVSVESLSTNSIPGVECVIYSSNKTIIIWADKTKTIVSCGEGDVYDVYVGFCAAVCKKLFGSTSMAKKILRKSMSAGTEN